MLDLLRREGLPFAGFIVNRVLQVPGALTDPTRVQRSADALIARLVHGGMAPEAARHLADRLRDGASRLQSLDAADATHVASLRKMAGSGTFLSVVPQMEHDIHTLPELRDLATQVEAIRPDSPELAAAHPLIVEAWKDRADGVEATLSAWRKADPVAAEAALNDRYSAARQEAAYFERINLVLVPEGYVLTPFSTATTAPTAAAD